MSNTDYVEEKMDKDEKVFFLGDLRDKGNCKVGIYRRKTEEEKEEENKVWTMKQEFNKEEQDSNLKQKIEKIGKMPEITKNKLIKEEVKEIENQINQARIIQKRYLETETEKWIKKEKVPGQNDEKLEREVNGERIAEHYNWNEIMKEEEVERINKVPRKHVLPPSSV